MESLYQEMTDDGQQEAGLLRDVITEGILYCLAQGLGSVQ